jgi:hypothetical protein
MSDFPGHAPPLNVIVSTYDRRYGVWPLGATGTQQWTQAWHAVYVPVFVPEPTIVTKMAVQSGNPASGSFDIGVYDEAGKRLVHTGLKSVSLNTLHVEDITDTLLTPGAYYLAMMHGGGNADYQHTGPSSAPGPAMRLLYGTKVQSLGANATLPSTATFAAMTTSRVPVITCTTRIPVL